MSLQAREIELREIRLPLREPFQISSGTTHLRRILLLELRDADGAVAWSECVAGETPNYFPETIETAWTVIRLYLAPLVLGRAFAAPGEVAALFERRVRGHQMAKAALEMGFWGLLAERRGVALAEVLGGERREVVTGISLGIQESPSALVERARAALEEGYLKIKIKIKKGADLEYLEAARTALGDDAPLMADANNAYDLADADHLRRLDDFALMMIEQPLAWDDLLRHAKLQKILETPICLDESIDGPDRAADMITLGSGRIVNVKPGRVGGFTAARAIHDLCASNGIPVWCGGMLESGIGRAYNVALASLPNFRLPGDISPSARYWEHDVVEPEWTMQAGRVAVPWEKPGLGVEIDRRRIEALTVRSEILTAD